MEADIKETIKRELPGLLREDPALRDYVIELTCYRYAGQQQTDDRFNQLLQELREDRIAQSLKWEEQNRKWEDQNRKWEDQNGKWEEQNRKWEEQNQKWEEQNRKFHEVHEEIMAQAKKVDRSIGALGARWGMQSEKAFRNALAGILEESFGVQVINVNEYDGQGEVFGRPDQIELDVIIKNGVLLICELKSSIDKAGMYIFERKARFYEKYHNCKANRLIVISPMIDDKARKVAQTLGIETYSDSLDMQNPIL